MPTPTLNANGNTATGLDLSAPFHPPPVGARTTGIAIRDWLAAVAMQGFINHGMKVKADRAMSEDERDEEIAERAYKMAAAMMRARTAAAKELEKP